MKKKFVFALITTIVVLSCKEKHNSPCDNFDETNSGSEWLSETIKWYSENGSGSPEIYELKYSWGVAILISPCSACSDEMVEIYDCQGNHICSVGGIAGINTCPSAYKNETPKSKLIWKK